MKKAAPTLFQLKAGHSLVMRTCDRDGRSYNQFAWPKKGPVSAPDWEPTKQCGNGLHGFLWGEGNGALADFSQDAVWIVVQVKSDCIIDLGGKVKYPKGEVVYYGAREEACRLVYLHAPKHVAIVGGTATAGDSGTATAGDSGTATAGDYGNIIIKYYDYGAGRYRLAVGEVGLGGILPNKAYVVENGKLVLKP